MNSLMIAPEEVMAMLRRELVRRGVKQEIVGVQICVEQPFGAGMLVHNEPPGLRIIFADA